MSSAQEISAIFRELSHHQRFAAVLVLADKGEMDLHELAIAMRAKGYSGPQHVHELERAGLVKITRVGHRKLVTLRPIVSVTPDAVEINAGGLPITIGRYLKEVA